MSDVDPEHVEWLWNGRIPRGKLTILEGDPKTGKSTLALDLAARVATGRAMPDGERLSHPGLVILMTAEDGLADTVRPRLDAAGADASRVIAWESVPVLDPEGGFTGQSRPPSLPRDIDALEEIIIDNGATLVVVDVLNAYLGSDVDGHRDQDVRRALMPLAKMAERTSVAVVVLRHLNKGSGSALYRGGGSIGIAGAARSILLAAVDPDDDSGTRRVLAVTGSNLAAQANALSYSLTSSSDHGCACIAWSGVSEHTSTSLLAHHEGEEERSALSEAKSFLRDELQHGPVGARQVLKTAHEAGISEKTIRRAKADLGVESAKTGMGSSWSWSLPGEGGQAGRAQDVGHVGNLRPDQATLVVGNAEFSEGAQANVLATFGKNLDKIPTTLSSFEPPPPDDDVFRSDELEPTW